MAASSDIQRLVYPPKVWAFTKDATGNVHNLTDYIVGGEVKRKISQVSSFTLRLRNPEMIFTTRGKKYATFHPMDPITIFMERIPGKHVQVFTGFLDSTPYLQLVPGIVTLHGSCTLKRLQYNWFQLAQEYTLKFFEHFGWYVQKENGTLSPVQGGLVESSYEALQKKKWEEEAKNGKITTTEAHTKIAEAEKRRSKTTQETSQAIGEGKKKKPQTPAFSTGGVSGGAQIGNDGSFKKMLWAFLYYVADWKDENIYIEPMPASIPKLITTLWTNFEKSQTGAREEIEAFWEALIGTGSAGTGGAAPKANYTGSNLKGSKREFAEAFARETGMDNTVVAAWLNHEQGATTVEGGNNWLNVETGTRGGSGPHSAEAKYVESLSPQAAGKYSAEWLKKNQPSIVAAAGKGQDAEVQAIENSGWAESHYGHESTHSFLSAAGALLQESTTKPKNISGQPEATERAGHSGPVSKGGTGPTSGVNAGGGHETEGNPYSVYHYPFAKAHVANYERVDMGVDYATAGAGEPLVAIGDGHVVAKVDGWFEGEPLLAYQITQSGPLHGIIVYYAEGISPIKNVGDPVKGGEPIAHTTSQPHGLEFGYADSNGTTLAAGEYTEGKVTKFGLMFARLMMKLGQPVPPNTGHPGNGQVVPGGAHEIIDTPGGSAGAGESGSGGENDMFSTATAASFISQIAAPTEAERRKALLGGQRSLMNVTTVLSMVQQVCKASLREFMSLPNGDFYAFHPDYFGEFGHRQPYWEIHNIEILDGNIELSDENLVTHAFAVGNTAWPADEPFLNEAYSGVMTIAEAFTPGVLLNHDDKKTHSDRKDLEAAVAFLRRYGARPLKLEYPMVFSTLFEQLLAYQQFLLAWSRQFRSVFKFTFMPELFPGGRVAFPEHGLQMYIEEVIHTWDLEGGGFQTIATLTAPSVFHAPGNQAAIDELPPHMVEALIEPQKGKVADKAPEKQRVIPQKTETPDEMRKHGEAFGPGLDSTGSNPNQFEKDVFG